MKSPIYAVYAMSDSSQDYLLGHYTGTKEDISTLLEDRKGYGLRFEEVNPIHVSCDDSRRLSKLIEAKGKVKEELVRLNDELKQLGYL